VFYERYLLDPNVTALEGPNGAGKTTVMIAAYLALFPDLKRLRFTNLGETGATLGDRGIWGRLGEAGRPSYSALRLRLADGSELLAGVLIERKAQPNVTLSPFTVTGLRPDMQLSELFLVRAERHDEVPTAQQLATNAKALGAELQFASSVKDYFQLLFALGVTPLRLSNDEERNKFNEMLRTSMTGGISRALTSELRSFLLKQESMLGDTLARMRANLSACRRTRTEVSEARVLEAEISGIFDAGHSMFCAARAATQARAREAEQQLRDQRAKVSELARELESLRARAAEDEAALARTEQRVGAHRDALKSAEEQLDQARRARDAKNTVAVLQEQLRDVANAAKAATEAQQLATSRRRQAHLDRDAARAASVRSAVGLADLQAGLDELHNKAHAYRRATSACETVCEALGVKELSPQDIPDRRAQLQHQKTALDEQRARRDRELTLGTQQADDYQLALAALKQLSDGVSAPGDTGNYARAQREMLLHKELQWRAQRLPELANELDACSKRVAQQRAAHAQAEQFGLAAEQRNSAHLAATLRAAEDELRALDAELGQAPWQQKELERLLEVAREETQRLERQQLRWEQLDRLARGLLPELREMAANDERGLDAALSQASARVNQLRQRQQSFAQEQSAVLQQAAALESSGGAGDPVLELLSEELDGQLLAQRYEDLDLDRAARVEAELGPLIDAIVVDDLTEAAAKLAKREALPSSVWLVTGGIDLPSALFQPPEPGTVAPGSERPGPQSTKLPEDVYRTPTGFRITRLPRHPKLGRTARGKEAARLRAVAERLRVTEDELAEELQQATLQIELLSQLRERRQDWLDGPREDALNEVRERQAELARDLDRKLEHSALLTAQANSKRATVVDARTLLGVAHWLDLPDQQAILEDLSVRLSDAQRAAEHLPSRNAALQVLSEKADALRYPPPTEAELTAWEQERVALQTKRDQLFQLNEALETLQADHQALLWQDAETAILEHAELVPELKSQQARDLARATAAEAALTSAEQAWEAATAAQLSAQATLAVAIARLESARSEWLSHDTSAEEGSSKLKSAERHVEQLRQRQPIIEKEALALVGQVAVLGERIKRVEHALDEARAAEQLAKQSADGPAEQWRGFLSACQNATAPLRDDRTESDDDRSSTQLWPLAHGRASLLVDRLDATKGGGERALLIRDRISKAQRSPLEYVEIWCSVRLWLQKCLPAQIAGVADPLEALRRLRSNLDSLELRLARQEGDLRGSSEDVARSIDVQVRRAASQVRRLNQRLQGVSFGSIHAIGVRMSRVEKMMQVLEALRDGSAQNLLFESALPIEQALEETFKRYGGGRGGGERVLDYREYVELQVEVKRHPDKDWEPANPTRVSTGEAIGVGAALMMVILSEWERDSKLLRAAEVSGTLRFLFLDEANRLSQDNLGVLFDLCESLDLQLLIAAPEVARALGNTTYRLVRKQLEDGTEEVIVSGRRATLPDQLTTADDGRGDLSAESERSPGPLTAPTDEVSISKPTQGVLLS
jgi:chromosome partition protein MukB